MSKLNLNLSGRSCIMMYFRSKNLRSESGLSASTTSAATQTVFFSISPSLESKATETEYDSSKEEHALRLMEAESLVAQLRAENLAQKNEVREYSGMPYMYESGF